jgi:hypothetical protein
MWIWELERPEGSDFITHRQRGEDKAKDKAMTNGKKRQKTF